MSETRCGRSLGRDEAPQWPGSLERHAVFLYIDDGRVSLTPAKWVGFSMRLGPRASSDRSDRSIEQRCLLKQKARAFHRFTLIGKSSGAWLIAALVPMLLALPGCMSHLPIAERAPVSLAQRVLPQRPPPAHGHHLHHATRPASPRATILSEAQVAEKEKLFRGFADWQGAQEAGP